MDFMSSFKAWLKALGLFYAGFLTAAFILSIIELAVLKLRGEAAQPHFINIALVSALIAVGFFLIYWGWFCFRSKLPFASASWILNYSAGLLLLPLVAVIGLLMKGIGLLDAAPILCRIALLIVPVLLLSEASSAILRIRSSKQAATPPSDEPAPSV